MSQKISACLVIYNEGKILSRCLDSLKEVVDEIVVVHDGPCQDDSLAIAERYGAKVFTQPHLGEAEMHRPFSYQQATGDWILQIDADEFLSAELRQAVRQLVENEEADGYAFAWPFFDGQRYIGKAFAKEIKHCLMRRDKLYMIGITHEFPKTKGRMVERTDLLLEHRPNYNNWTFGRMRHKWFRWGKIQAANILALPQAATFGLDDIRVAWEYGFYQRMIQRPYWTATKFVKNIWRKALPSFDWVSWRIAWLMTINQYYLARQIARQSRQVLPGEQWWLDLTTPVKAEKIAAD